MRILAVDFGDTRTGFAVSDASASFIGDAWTVTDKNINSVAKYIAAQAAARDVNTIVVGYPKNMNGSIGPRAEKSEQLAQIIARYCDIKVVLWDERLTTSSAHKILSETGRHGKKRKNTVDAVAASLILEGYLRSLP